MLRLWVAVILLLLFFSAQADDKLDCSRHLARNATERYIIKKIRKDPRGELEVTTTVFDDDSEADEAQASPYKYMFPEI